MVHDGLITVGYVLCHKNLCKHLCEEMPGVLTAVCLLLVFFVSSSEEKDGKTESKDEKRE